MSINAHAPPSFCDANFLDSPPDSDFSPDTPTPSSKSCVTRVVNKADILDILDDNASVTSSVQASSDGFMEVRSKSSKKQRQKNQALLASKDKKSSASEDRRKDIKVQR